MDEASDVQGPAHAEPEPAATEKQIEETKKAFRSACRPRDEQMDGRKQRDSERRVRELHHEDEKSRSDVEFRTKERKEKTEQKRLHVLHLF